MAKKKSKKPSSILLELPEEFDNAQAAQAAGSYMDGYVPEEGDWDLPDTRSGETMEQMAAEDAEKPYPPNPYAIRTEVPEDVPETVSEQEPPVVEPAPESDPDHGLGTGEPKNTDLIKTMGDYSDRPQNYSLFQDLMTPKESPYSYGGAEFAREMEKTREAALADRPEVAAALGADLQDLVTPATSLADKRGSAEASEFQENRKNKQALVSDVLGKASNLDSAANSNLLAANDLMNNISEAQTDLDNLDSAIKQKQDIMKEQKLEVDDKGNVWYNGKIASPTSDKAKAAYATMTEINNLENQKASLQTKIDNANKRVEPIVNAAQMQRDTANSLNKMLGLHTRNVDYTGMLSRIPTTSTASTPSNKPSIDTKNDQQNSVQQNIQDQEIKPTNKTGDNSGKRGGTPPKKTTTAKTEIPTMDKKILNYVAPLLQIGNQKASILGTSYSDPDLSNSIANGNAESATEANIKANDFINNTGKINDIWFLYNALPALQIAINSMGTYGTPHKKEMIDAVKSAFTRTITPNGWVKVPVDQRKGVEGGGNGIDKIWDAFNHYGFTPNEAKTTLNNYKLW